MSAEQFRYWADLEGIVRPVRPAPPDVPTAAPPQRPAGPPAIVLPLRENEAAGPHGLAALGTGSDIVHTAHLNAATAFVPKQLRWAHGLGLMCRPPALMIRRRCHAVRHAPLLRQRLPLDLLRGSPLTGHKGTVSRPACLGERPRITAPLVRLEKPCLDHPVPLPSGSVLPLDFSVGRLRKVVGAGELGAISLLDSPKHGLLGTRAAHLAKRYEKPTAEYLVGCQLHVGDRRSRSGPCGALC
ncbi:hypothetical protein EV284_4329 [Streptomyces sp. BK022]|nr:hypothetical protein EV284_4329 [Streptomyces sp. BK022]